MKNNATNSDITYCIALTDEQLIQAKNLCHDVYLRVGYISEPYPDRIIPNELEHASTYVIAVDNDKVVGTLRLTAGPPFTTLNIWKNELFVDSNTLMNDVLRGAAFEIGALAVNKEYSSLKVAQGLYKSAYYYSVILGLQYGIVCIDTRALRTLEMSGWKAIRIGEPKMYFGSLTVPAVMPINIQPVAAHSVPAVANYLSVANYY